MKLKTLIVALCAFALSIPYASAADHEEKHEEHTPLEEAMSQMNKAWRSIRRSADDPAKNAETLEHLATVQAKALEGIEMVPARKEDVPADQQAEFMKGYVKEMEVLVDMLDKLEAMLKAGDNEGAVAIVKKINDHRKASHKEYKRPDED